MRPIAFARAVIGSTLFALAFYSLTVLFVTMAALASFVGPRPLASVVRGWSRMHRICCRLLLGQKIRVEGEMPDVPVLYVFKHESMFETIDLLCFFRAPAPVAKRELTDIPGWGHIALRYGVIPLDRAAGAGALRQLQRDARRMTSQGRPVCLFPEGTRVPHGEMPPIKAGFAGLYQLLGLPVIPVAVNSGRISPRGRFVKWPGVITYKVGDAIPPGLSRNEAEARVHAAINSLNRADGDGHERANC